MNEEEKKMKALQTKAAAGVSAVHFMSRENALQHSKIAELSSEIVELKDALRKEEAEIVDLKEELRLSAAFQALAAEFVGSEKVSRAKAICE